MAVAAPAVVGLTTIVIASEAKQSSASRDWIASSLRFSQ
jgi:hypothetical protein